MKFICSLVVLGAAVSVTDVKLVKVATVAAQVVPQVIPAGSLVTVPVLMPEIETVRA